MVGNVSCGRGGGGGNGDADEDNSGVDFVEMADIGEVGNVSDRGLDDAAGLAEGGTQTEGLLEEVEEADVKVQKGRSGKNK